MSGCLTQEGDKMDERTLPWTYAWVAQIWVLACVVEKIFLLFHRLSISLSLSPLKVLTCFKTVPTRKMNALPVSPDMRALVALRQLPLRGNPWSSVTPVRMARQVALTLEITTCYFQEEYRIKKYTIEHRYLTIWDETQQSIISFLEHACCCFQTDRNISPNHTSTQTDGQFRCF